MDQRLVLVTMLQIFILIMNEYLIKYTSCHLLPHCVFRVDIVPLGRRGLLCAG